MHIGYKLLYFRLNTIADYDKVMVIDAGKVAEYGEPFYLLSKDINDPKID